MATSKVNKSIFIDLSVPAKITYSRDRVVDMTGNPNFSSPSPSLATVTTVTNNLETKQLAAQGGGPAQTAARDAAEVIWNNTMRSLADYVDGIALGDVVKITSAGFTATDIARTPHLVPVKPLNLTLKHSPVSGAVILNCDVVPDAEGYVAVLSTDVAAIDIAVAGTQLMIRLNTEPVLLAAPPPVSGTLLVIDSSKERKKTIIGLETGKRIYAKMYCFNAAGRGADSDSNSIIVA